MGIREPMTKPLSTAVKRSGRYISFLMSEMVICSMTVVLGSGFQEIWDHDFPTIGQSGFQSFRFSAYHLLFLYAFRWLYERVQHTFLLLH